MSTDELLSMLGSGDPVSVQCHIIKVSVSCISISFCLFCPIVLPTFISSYHQPIDCGTFSSSFFVVVCLSLFPDSIAGILFQMFENIKSLRLETNLNCCTVIKGMISTEGEFLQFQNEGLYTTFKFYTLGYNINYHSPIWNSCADCNVNRNAYQTFAQQSHYCKSYLKMFRCDDDATAATTTTIAIATTLPHSFNRCSHWKLAKQYLGANVLQSSLCDERCDLWLWQKRW